MIDLWNALPDAIHYAGVAVLGHNPVLHALVDLWCWLSGLTLFEDGSIGRYAVAGIVAASRYAMPEDYSRGQVSAYQRFRSFSNDGLSWEIERREVSIRVSTQPEALDYLKGTLDLLYCLAEFGPERAAITARVAASYLGETIGFAEWEVANTPQAPAAPIAYTTTDALTYAVADYLEAQTDTYTRPGFDDDRCWVEVSMCRDGAWSWAAVNIAEDGTIGTDNAEIRRMLQESGFLAISPVVTPTDAAPETLDADGNLTPYGDCLCDFGAEVASGEMTEDEAVAICLNVVREAATLDAMREGNGTFSVPADGARDAVANAATGDRPCPHCNGAGQVLDGDMYVHTEWKSCHHCGGTGAQSHPSSPIQNDQEHEELGSFIVNLRDWLRESTYTATAPASAANADDQPSNAASEVAPPGGYCLSVTYRDGSTDRDAWLTREEASELAKDFSDASEVDSLIISDRIDYEAYKSYGKRRVPAYQNGGDHLGMMVTFAEGRYVVTHVSSGRNPPMDIAPVLADGTLGATRKPTSWIDFRGAVPYSPAACRPVGSPSITAEQNNTQLAATSDAGESHTLTTTRPDRPANATEWTPAQAANYLDHITTNHAFWVERLIQWTETGESAPALTQCERQIAHFREAIERHQATYGEGYEGMTFNAPSCQWDDVLAAADAGATYAANNSTHWPGWEATGDPSRVTDAATLSADGYGQDDDDEPEDFGGPIWVQCYDCGHEWRDHTFVRPCPKCGSKPKFSEEEDDDGSTGSEAPDEHDKKELAR